MDGERDYKTFDLYSDLSPEENRYYGDLVEEFAIEDPEEHELYEVMQKIRSMVDEFAYDNEKHLWCDIEIDELFGYMITWVRNKIRAAKGPEYDGTRESVLASCRTLYRAISRIRTVVRESTKPQEHGEL